jgi:hypothetical protein
MKRSQIKQLIKEAVEGGSIMTTDENGNKFWTLPNGKLHRENGPAVEFTNGDKYWYINGEKHREDGPAVEWDNGDKLWYSKGIRIS